GSGDGAVSEEVGCCGGGTEPAPELAASPSWAPTTISSTRPITRVPGAVVASAGAWYSATGVPYSSVHCARCATAQSRMARARVSSLSRAGRGLGEGSTGSLAVALPTGESTGAGPRGAA